jgi:hypothetical protein
MNLKKILSLALMLVSPFVTPGFAQVYWSNQSPAGVTDDIWCVTYANGTFAAVTNQGNLLTSANGLTWNSEAIDPGVWLVSIAYGNGLWVVVGDKGTVLVSSDLKTWVSKTSGTANKLNGVLYNGTIWVAVGEVGTVVSSPDAQTWTDVTFSPGEPNPSVTGFLHGITLIPTAEGADGIESPTATAFLVSGANGVMLEGSSNGVFDGRVGSNTTLNLEAVLYPDPGTSRTEGGDYAVPIVAVGWGGTILYGEAAYGGWSQLGNNLFTSSPSSIPNVILRGLTFGAGYYVTAGEQGTILSSTDGVNWTQRFSGNSPSTLSSSTFLSAAYSEPLQCFVITGTGGTILVSNSAPTVFGNVSTRGYVSNAQTFIGGFYVSGSAPRTVLIRADGPVLSTFSVPSPLPDPVLTVYNSAGTAVATNTGWTTNVSPLSISAAAQQVGAFALPNPSADSALLLTLQPGTYTVQITSAKGSSGIALFEAYTN